MKHVNFKDTLYDYIMTPGPDSDLSHTYKYPVICQYPRGTTSHVFIYIINPFFIAVHSDTSIHKVAIKKKKHVNLTNIETDTSPLYYPANRAM